MFNFTKKEIEDFLKEKALKRRGLKLNLENPKTVQDKISWLIVNSDCDELKSRCADKILLHEYSKEKLGKDICIPILKVYDSPDDLDFSELPDKFVLKCNHGYAMNIIVDKGCNTIKTLKKIPLENEEDCKRQLTEWLGVNFGEINRQKHYALIKPRCYAEKFMDDGNKTLKDYKFWCCNGEPKMIQVISERYTKDIYCNVYDTDWNWFHLGWTDFPENKEQLDRRPKHLDKMLEYARKLSEDFIFVRVDFYVINDEVYLGELTFTPDGGIFNYKDVETEIYWGDQIRLDGGVSICVSAYKASDYIKECLDSINGQTYFNKNKNWEVIVGIDGCEETLEKMKEIMYKYDHLRVLMMDSNKGTYVTSNTLFKEAKYNNVIRFDSDDMMIPDMVETIMKKKGDCAMLRYNCRNFGENVQKDISITYGTNYFKRDVFLKYGGFRPWPCSSDGEYIRRIKHIEEIKELPDILMLRRVHKNSLTMSEKTGMNSDFRKPYKEFVKKLDIRNENDATINLVTNTFKEIGKFENTEDDRHNKLMSDESVEKLFSMMSDIERQMCRVSESIDKQTEKISELLGTQTEKIIESVEKISEPINTQTENIVESIKDHTEKIGKLGEMIGVIVDNIHLVKHKQYVKSKEQEERFNEIMEIRKRISNLDNK